MSEVNVDVFLTGEGEPFGVRGTISVNDSVFDLNRTEFSEGALSEINRLSAELLEVALSEYDRRNA